MRLLRSSILVVLAALLVPAAARAQHFSARADSLMDVALQEGFRPLSLEDMRIGQIHVSKMSVPQLVWIRTLYTEPAAGWAYSEIALALDCFSGRTRIDKAFVQFNDGRDSSVVFTSPSTWFVPDSGTRYKDVLASRCRVVPVPGVLREREREPARSAILRRVAGPRVPGMPADSSFRLARLEGRVVLVEMWEPSCLPCASVHGQLTKLLPPYLAKSVTALSIGIADSARIVAWLGRNGGATLSTFPLTEASGAAFDGTSVPHIIVLDRRGRIAFDAIGYQHDYLHIMPGVLDTLLAERK